SLPENGPGAMDHQRPDVSVTALGDPQQPCLPAAGFLPWDEPQPCGELAAVLEAASVPDSRDQRRGRHRTDPLDLAYAPTHLVRSEEVFESPVVGRNASIKAHEFLSCIADELENQTVQTAVIAIDDLRE